jgi:small-conductance mechanosensitive channel
MLSLVACFPGQLQAQDTPTRYYEPRHEQAAKSANEVVNPSVWLNQTENTLMLLEGRLQNDFDTSFMPEKFNRLEKDFQLALNDFTRNGRAMRIRALDDALARLEQIKKQLEGWRTRINRISSEISSEIYTLHGIRGDTIATIQQVRDSLVWSVYQDAFRITQENIQRIDTLGMTRLSRIVTIENRLNKLEYEVNQLIQAARGELRIRSNALYQKTHPAFWELNTHSYPVGIGPVFMETLRQNLDSLKFYGKNAYLRAILFRLLILLISLVPIWYFRKLKKEGRFEHANMKYRYVHKYTGAATSSFVLVLAPYIFINAPHIFLEAIFITLTFIATLIFIKENPELGKRRMLLILIVFTLLKIANLMVAVTLFGRIIWTLGIFLLIPIGVLFSKINISGVRNKWLFQIILTITILMYAAGWILNVAGHYPLGRILMIAGMEQFFLAIILSVAIYSFIDFVAILGDLYNRRNKASMVRVELIYGKLLNLVTFLAVLSWFVSLLWNLNSFEFVSNRISEIFNRTLTFGGTEFKPGSFVLFFIVVYLSFYISSLLEGIFYDEQRSAESTSKTGIGSIVVLLRFLILSAGFFVGLFVAGIPLSSLNLFVGALGLGIGFGIQQLVNNLLAGIIIAFEKPIYVGDVVEVEGMKGRVTDIGLRATRVDTTDGAELIIPNGELTSRTMKNWTLTSKLFKLENMIQVDLEHDPDEITRIIEQCLKETTGVMATPPAVVRLKEISPVALKFVVSCWLEDIAVAGPVQHNLLKKIHQAFDASGVKYPRRKESDDLL